jgi:imidazolonepropionase-like amidohydrolase
MKAIRSKQLVVDAGKRPIPQGIVLVDGSVIRAAGSPDEVPVPAGCDVIDCTGDTVMPGLIDAHAHITADTSYNIPLTEHYALDLATAVLRGSMNLRKDLAAGVTTMRTLGDRSDVELRFRDAIEANTIPGPRLIISIRALGPSHGTAKFIRASADGEDELRHRIRENFAMGAQVLKLFVSNVQNGDRLEDYLRGDLTTAPAYSRPELMAAIDEAHGLGMTVAGHAIGGPSMRWAMEAGIDSVEHANLLEEQDIQYFTTYGTFLSDPNLQLFFDDETGFETRESWQHDWWRQKVILAREHTRKYLPQAIRAGVRVCLGTDSTHGSLWREARCLVALGASCAEALLAVTKHPAELLGLSNKVGTLEPGKLADVISLCGDPLTDITALRDVGMVMKAGRRF